VRIVTRQRVGGAKPVLMLVSRLIQLAPKEGSHVVDTREHLSQSGRPGILGCRDPRSQLRRGRQTGHSGGSAQVGVGGA
jgi:hypothetical protein